MNVKNPIITLLKMKEKIITPRICYRCKYPLYRSDYFSRNDHIPKQKLKEIWENKNVEILCCECYKKCDEHPKQLNDRLIEISKGDLFDLDKISRKIQEAEGGINLEPINFFAHNTVKNLFFIDFYHDVNIRYRYIVSDDKSTLLDYISSHESNSPRRKRRKVSRLNINGGLYFYQFYEKTVEL